MSGVSPAKFSDFTFIPFTMNARAAAFSGLPDSSAVRASFRLACALATIAESLAFASSLGESFFAINPFFFDLSFDVSISAINRCGRSDVSQTL